MWAVPVEWKDRRQALLDSAPPLQPLDGDFRAWACDDVRDLARGRAASAQEEDLPALVYVLRQYGTCVCSMGFASPCFAPACRTTPDTSPHIAPPHLAPTAPHLASHQLNGTSAQPAVSYRPSSSTLTAYNTGQCASAAHLVTHIVFFAAYHIFA